MIFQEDAKELLERNKERGPILGDDLIWSYENFDNFELSKLALSRLINKIILKGKISRIISLNALKKLQIAYLHSLNNSSSNQTIFQIIILVKFFRIIFL